jgi:hypothetical protein
MPPYRQNLRLDMGSSKGAAREKREMTTNRLPPHLALACGLLLAGLSQAFAQFLPGPGQASPPAQFPPAQGPSGAFPPPPGQPGAFPPPPGRTGGAPAGGASPFPPPGGQSVCATFPSLRGEVEKAGLAIKAASERKATREEVCPLFKTFAAREAKMVKFLVSNQSTCSIPGDAIKNAKSSHAKTLQIRNQVCNPAAAAPAGPSLSDVLGGPIIADDTSTQKRGGTFETLTGNALSR